MKYLANFQINQNESLPIWTRTQNEQTLLLQLELSNREIIQKLTQYWTAEFRAVSLQLQSF